MSPDEIQHHQFVYSCNNCCISDFTILGAVCQGSSRYTEFERRLLFIQISPGTTQAISTLAGDQWKSSFVGSRRYKNCRWDLSKSGYFIWTARHWALDIRLALHHTPKHRFQRHSNQKFTYEMVLYCKFPTFQKVKSTSWSRTCHFYDFVGRYRFRWRAALDKCRTKKRHASKIRTTRWVTKRINRSQACGRSGTPKNHRPDVR